MGNLLAPMAADQACANDFAKFADRRKTFPQILQAAFWALFPVGKPFDGQTFLNWLFAVALLLFLILGNQYLLPQGWYNSLDEPEPVWWWCVIFGFLLYWILMTLFVFLPARPQGCDQVIKTVQRQFNPFIGSKLPKQMEDYYSEATSKNVVVKQQPTFV